MASSERKGLEEKSSNGIGESFDTSSSEGSEGAVPRNDKDGYSRLTFSAFFHLMILFCLSIATIFVTSSSRMGGAPNIPSSSSPAEEAVIYQRQTVDNTLQTGNQFIGEPSPAIDDAWDSIIQYKNLALDPSLVDEMDAVEINDGSGRVLANLDVFYNLHCLNFARKYIFRSEYPLQFPGNGHQVQRGYLTHCIDSIRQSLVCHADIALHTYTWEDFQLVPYPDFKVDHECKNWDSIVNWTKKYAAPSLGGSVLKHPVYGPSFPDL